MLITQLFRSKWFSMLTSVGGNDGRTIGSIEVAALNYSLIEVRPKYTTIHIIINGQSSRLMKPAPDQSFQISSVHRGVHDCRQVDVRVDEVHVTE